MQYTRVSRVQVCYVYLQYERNGVQCVVGTTSAQILHTSFELAVFVCESMSVCSAALHGADDRVASVFTYSLPYTCAYLYMHERCECRVCVCVCNRAKQCKMLASTARSTCTRIHEHEHIGKPIPDRSVKVIATSRVARSHDRPERCGCRRTTRERARDNEFLRAHKRTNSPVQFCTAHTCGYVYVCICESNYFMECITQPNTHYRAYSAYV